MQEPKIQKLDAVQSSPKIDLPPVEEATGSSPESTAPGQLFGPAGENARAYSRVALWAKAFHPPRPEPLQLSASAIDAYERCPMKYMFQYHWSIRGGPHAAMTFGNVMHTVIKECVAEIQKKGAVPFEEVLAIYDREWYSAGFADEYQEKEYRQAGREQLEAFHRSYSAAPADVMFQEKPFELPLEHEVVITGRMDQVNRIGKNEVEIVDYKTGRARDAKKAAEDLQLSIYALAAREVLDLNPGKARVLQPCLQRAGGNHARREIAESHEGKNHGSGGHDSRGGISREARLWLQVLRFQADLPGTRTIDFDPASEAASARRGIRRAAQRAPRNKNGTSSARMSRFCFSRKLR